MKKVIETIVLIILLLTTSISLYFSFNYKPTYKIEHGNRIRIPDVKFENFTSLISEVKTDKYFEEAYYEKILGYLESNPMIYVSAFSDWELLKEDLSNTVVSGKLPKNSNEVVIDSAYLNNKEVYDSIDNEGYINLNLGEFSCDSYFTDPLSCDKTVTNVQQKRFKVVGVTSGIPGGIFTILDNDLNLEEHVNVYFKLKESEPEEYYDKLIEKYSESFGECTREEDGYCEGSHRLNAGSYQTDGSIIEIKNFIYDNFIVFLVMTILITTCLICLLFYQTSKVITFTQISLSLIAAVLLLCSSVHIRNLHEKAVFYDKQISVIKLIEKDIESDLNNMKYISNVEKDGVKYSFDIENRKGLVNYYNFARKNDLNDVTIKGNITIYDPEYRIIEIIILFNKIIISNISLLVISIIVYISKFITLKKRNN